MRVRNWNKHYENAKSRTIREISWFSMPNKMDNEGYVSLVSHPDGAAHLGAWTAILQIASRNTPRGSLLRRDGTPHTPESLALISRLPASVFTEALPRLFSMGWLESDAAVSAQYPRDARPVSSQYPSDTLAVSARYPSGGSVREGKEQKERTEGEDGLAKWETFKATYPAHRLDEEAACRAFLSREDEAEAILSGLQAALASEDWTKESGKFVPTASKFIFDGKYKDALRLKPAAPPQPAVKRYTPPK